MPRQKKEAEAELAADIRQAEDEITLVLTWQEALAAADALDLLASIDAGENLDAGELERIAFVIREQVPSDEWRDLFEGMRNGDEKAIEEAVTLIRTHAIPEDHPYAID